MGINNNKFKEYLEYFKSSISLMNSQIGLSASVSFHTGIIEEHEGYKKELALKGQNILKFDSWDKAQIGSGNIAAAVKKAMRMNDGSKPHNLVDYRDKDDFEEYVDADIIGSEKLFYEIYCGKDEETAFKHSIEFFGEKYPIISFLFFLKDCSRYVPARPNTFTDKFLAIGLDPGCLKKCSWENFNEYISIFEEIQLFLMDEFDDNDITLLDAHSFVWMSWILEKNEEELKAIARYALIDLDFSETKDKYDKVAQLLDSLFEAQEFQGSLSNIESESVVTKLRKDFVKKYSPEQLEKLTGYEIVSRFYDIGSDSLIRCISLDSDYRIFGSAQHTSNNIYPLYYTKEEGWCTKNQKALSLDNVIEIGRKFRNKFVMCMKHISNMPLVTVEDYEYLGKYLKDQLGDQGERVWIHKYLHMLYPDKFSEFHSVEWKRYLLCALQIKPRDSFYGMAGQIAQIQQRMKLKDPYVFSHFIYAQFPEINKGGICRLTFKPGYEKQTKDWIAGERVTLNSSDFEGKIRSSKWFYGASEKARNYLFVIEKNNGELVGVATSLSGEPENGKRFDSRTGIWHPCFSPGSVLPIKKDSDSNSTIKKVENILYIYKYYYSFYDISAQMMEIYKNNKEEYDQASEAYELIRIKLLEKYPAKINILKDMTYDYFDINVKESFLDIIVNELSIYGGIGLDIQNIGLDDINNNFTDYLINICLLIGSDYMDFDKVEENPLDTLLKLKILSIYHPEKYIGITDEELLDLWLDMLQIHVDKKQSIWVKQSAILNWKKQHAIFDYNELSDYLFIRLLYGCSDLNNHSENDTEDNSDNREDDEASIYLLTWNPDVWYWDKDYSEILNSVAKGEKFIEPWTVSNGSIKPGDYIYLMRLGGEPKGIIAKGKVVSNVYLHEHYDEERAAKGEKTKHVDVQFIKFLDYENEKIISLEKLNNEFPKQLWTPFSSGIRIKQEYWSDLNKLWDKYSRESYNTSKGNHEESIINVDERERFYRDVVLKLNVEAKRYNGMNRVHLKCNSVGFAVFDMNKHTYNLATREKIFKSIGVDYYEMEDNLGPNHAIVKGISYSDTEILYKLIDYIKQRKDNIDFIIKDYHVTDEEIEASEKEELIIQRKIDEYISDGIDSINIDDFEYIPGPEEKKLVKETDNSSGGSAYPRDPQKRVNALKRAKFTCEFNPEHESFISRSTNMKYMETHHLIPLEYWKFFEKSLDVEANIVCLCSNCHNEIHYGKHSSRLIKPLYEKRKKELIASEIDIDIDELIAMYEGVYRENENNKESHDR